MGVQHRQWNFIIVQGQVAQCINEARGRQSCVTHTHESNDEGKFYGVNNEGNCLMRLVTADGGQTWKCRMAACRREARIKGRRGEKFTSGPGASRLVPDVGGMKKRLHLGRASFCLSPHLRNGVPDTSDCRTTRQFVARRLLGSFMPFQFALSQNSDTPSTAGFQQNTRNSIQRCTATKQCAHNVFKLLR